MSISRRTRFSIALALSVSSVLTYQKPAVCQTEELPASFSWIDRGAVTPAKNQGEFGTCWAFAAIGLVEALVRLETGEEVDLSEQHLISNIRMASPFAAVDFLKSTGVVREAHLPYVGDTSSVNTERPGEFFLDEYTVTNVNRSPLSERVSTIKRIIYENGPVLTTMNLMHDFKSYESGVYVYDGHSREQSGGHIILIFGWTDDPDVTNGGYWILKNSAGTHWGENGFGKAAYGQAGIDDYYVIHGILRLREPH